MMKRLLLVTLLVGCADSSMPLVVGDHYGDVKVDITDHDGDGLSEFGGDCDDTNPEILPGVPENCEPVDMNCDGDLYKDAVDAQVAYRDRDQDGYGDPEQSIEHCGAIPQGMSADNTDCNDDPENGGYLVNPGADEECNFVDDNCDGDVDGDPVSGGDWYYDDRDDDGFGMTDSAVYDCSAPFRHVLPPGDCDDDDETIFPGAVEVCDGIDNDCSGSVDENAIDTPVWYEDTDLDGYAGAEAAWIGQCDMPAETGWTQLIGDCAPDDPTISAGAEEVCDGIDNDCDENVDEDVTTTFYEDRDRDGSGGGAVASESCEDLGEGWSTNNDDCDDDAADIHPDAAEVCNDIDDNCDGIVDVDAVDAVTLYEDADDDGWGAPEVSMVSCPADGWVASSGDCDDAVADVHPDAAEVCNDIDDDCDGTADVDAVDAVTLYEDADEDGLGDPDVSMIDCPADGWVDNDDDRSPDFTGCYDLDVVAPPSEVMAVYDLDPFYEKYVDANGFPILSSGLVDDEALMVACEIVVEMLSMRPEVIEALYENRIRFGVMGVTEVTTDMPEHSDLYDVWPGTDWDAYRGVGSTLVRPLASVGEENVLHLPGDPYEGESILVHEFAHAYFDTGVAYLTDDSDDLDALLVLYDAALTAGTWADTFAESNFHEYWAEAVQSWFNTNLESDPPDGIHGPIDTRDELWAADPEMAAFISGFFYDSDWIVP